MLAARACASEEALNARLPLSSELRGRTLRILPVVATGGTTVHGFLLFVPGGSVA